MYNIEAGAANEKVIAGNPEQGSVISWEDATKLFPEKIFQIRELEKELDTLPPFETMSPVLAERLTFIQKVKHFFARDTHTNPETIRAKQIQTIRETVDEDIQAIAEMLRGTNPENPMFEDICADIIDTHGLIGEDANSMQTILSYSQMLYGMEEGEDKDRLRNEVKTLAYRITDKIREKGQEKIRVLE